MELKCLLKGIKGAEGPCYTLDNRLFMVGSDEGRIVEVLASGSRELANTGGIPAGLQVDHNNDLWVADMKLGILRVNLKGEIFPEVTTFNNKPIRGCNDCYFDSQGNLYFTAPAGSDADNQVGELFCRLANGTVNKLDDGFAFCNGLAVTADDRTLIVAETFGKNLYAYDLPDPGTVSNKRLWGTLPGDHPGGPDGMDFDVEGKLLVANWGGSAIEIFLPDGTHDQTIKVPFNSPSNVHFLGPDSSELVITEHQEHGIWQGTYQNKGQRQYGWDD